VPFYFNTFTSALLRFWSYYNHPGDPERDAVYHKRCPGQAPPILAFHGTVIRSGGGMNRGPTLLFYNFRFMTYNSATRTHAKFTIRAYLKNGKRWAKFPSLARMVVIEKVWCHNTR
jgi:hypothetical protein